MTPNPRNDLSVLSVKQKSDLKQNYIEFWFIIAIAFFMVAVLAYIYFKYLPVFTLVSSLVQLATIVAAHHNLARRQNILHGSKEKKLQ